MKRILLLILFSQMITACFSMNTSNKNDELISAAAAGRIYSVEGALNSGADINKRGGYWGKEALYVASYNGHIEVVKFLLDNEMKGDLRLALVSIEKKKQGEKFFAPTFF